MANYNGMIVNRPILKATRKMNRRGNVFNTPVLQVGTRKVNRGGNLIITSWYKIGARSSVKKGLDLRNYNIIKFERIPKEKILNRLRQLGNNIQY